MDKPFQSFITLRTTNKRHRNSILTNSVPCYTSLVTLKEIQASNLWRVKPIRNQRLSDMRSTCIKHPVISKQSDVNDFLGQKEVPESAEIRATLDENGKCGDSPLKLKPIAEKNKKTNDVIGDVRTLGKFRPTSPTIPLVKHIGHTSRYKEWSNMRLAEVLKDRPVPGGVRENSEDVEDSNKMKTLERPSEDEGEGYKIDSSWHHVANTQLVDKDIYDRYARVKL